MNIKTISHCLVTLVALPLSTTSYADNDESNISSFAVDTKLTATSDIRTRGISDSLKSPGLKLNVQAVHESGLLGMLEIGSVSKKQFPDGKGISAVLAGGYRFGDPDRWHFGVGLASELFPGARFSAPQAFDFDKFTPTDVRSDNYNTQFALFEIGYGDIEGRVLNVLSENYRGANTGSVCGAILQFAASPEAALTCYGRGQHNSRGSWLLDLDYKYRLTAATTLHLHAGYQRIANFNEVNATDYRVGLVHKRWGYEWNLDWLSTRTNARELYLVQDGNRLRATDDSTVVFSVVKRF